MRMPETSEQAVEIFKKWINQRSGLDTRNYFSDWRDQDGRRALREDQSRIQKQGREARELLATFAELPYDPEMLRGAMSHAYAGRLTFNQTGSLEYCAGQYFPTEYRAAAAACLEQYISDMRRKGIGIPADAIKQHGQTITVSELKAIAKGHGSHFFDASTMRFFNSKVHGPVFSGADGWYFVTSEKFDGPGHTLYARKYTVRRMTRDAEIDEPEGHADAFQKYTTAAQALKVARQFAADSMRAQVAG